MWPKAVAIWRSPGGGGFSDTTGRCGPYRLFFLPKTADPTTSFHGGEAHRRRAVAARVQLRTIAARAQCPDQWCVCMRHSRDPQICMPAMEHMNSKLQVWHGCAGAQCVHAFVCILRQLVHLCVRACARASFVQCQCIRTPRAYSYSVHARVRVYKGLHVIGFVLLRPCARMH